MILTLHNIQDAMTGTKVKDWDAGALKDSVTAIVADASRMAGYEKTLYPEDCSELARDLARGAAKLTLDEIRLACKAGVAGELGDVKKPSYSAVIRWVEAYDKSAMVADARKIMANRKPEPRRISEDEGLQLMRVYMPQNAKRRWESVRVSGSFPRESVPHVSAQIYDWLKDEGKLQIPADIRREALAKARAGLVKGTSLPVGNIEAGERLVTSLAKHLALEGWMRGMIERGESLDLPPVRKLYN